MLAVSQQTYQRLAYSLAWLGDVLLILIVVGVANRYELVVLDILAFIVIASRQHALLVLFHDGTHYLFSLKKSSNDLIVDVFIGSLFFYSVHNYRSFHFDHHKNLNSQSDPEMSYWKRFGSPPTTTGQLLQKMLLAVWEKIKELVLERFNIVKLLSFRDWPRSQQCGFIVAIVIVASLASLGLLATWFYYWLLPWTIFLPMIMYIRGIMEHQGSEDTREIVCGALERFFLAPHSVGYHKTHHLFPHLPFYALKRQSRILQTTNAQDVYSSYSKILSQNSNFM